MYENRAKQKNDAPSPESFIFYQTEAEKRGKMSGSNWILQDAPIIKSSYYPPAEWHNSERNADCGASHSRQKENLDVSGC